VRRNGRHNAKRVIAAHGADAKLTDLLVTSPIAAVEGKCAFCGF
jgi:hypothetical protein